MNKKEYTDYIQDVLNSVKEIEDFTKGLTYEKFIQDTKTINAVIRSLEVIGEASNNIPESIRADYPEIPWESIIGMRNKLIHEYFGVNLKIIWKTIQSNIPKVKPLFERIKKDLNENQK